MADLKTTYKDDVLNTSANEKRKYNMITNEDGTVSLEDVTDYSQVGDSFGAADINATNEKVNELNTNLSNIKSDLQWKYAGESSGVGSSVTIPQNCNELSIVCRYKGFTNKHYCTVPKINGILCIPITISSTSTYALNFLVDDTSVKIYSESSPGTINTTTYPIIQEVYYR